MKKCINIENSFYDILEYIIESQQNWIKILKSIGMTNDEYMNSDKLSYDRMSELTEKMFSTINTDE